MNMEHGLFVPFAAAYMVWMKQDELKLQKLAPSWWGVSVVLFATLLFFLSTVAQWIWVSRVAFLASLVGCVWAVCGFRLVRQTGLSPVHPGAHDRAAQFYQRAGHPAIAVDG